MVFSVLRVITSGRYHEHCLYVITINISSTRVDVYSSNIQHVHKMLTSYLRRYCLINKEHVPLPHFPCKHLEKMTHVDVIFTCLNILWIRKEHLEHHRAIAPMFSLATLQK